MEATAGLSWFGADDEDWTEAAQRMGLAQKGSASVFHVAEGSQDKVSLEGCGEPGNVGRCRQPQIRDPIAIKPQIP